MENASKALIIAGAILISILIIGLGVFIYQQAQSTVSKANLNSPEAQAQNQQFENYFGDKRSAQEVKQLCTTVRSNNITGETGDETKKVWLVYDNAFKTPSEISKLVKAGKTYDVNVANDKADDKGDISSSDLPGGVTAPAYWKNGFIKVITIKENGASGSKPTGGSNSTGGTNTTN